jgi:hypothetical protein
MFQALMVQSTSSTVAGQITVNASADNGAGSLQLTKAATGTNYTLEFCEFPTPNAVPNGQTNTCSDITMLTTDGSGNAQISFTMPKGVWAGVFSVVRNNFGDFNSGFILPGAGQQYRAPFVPALPNFQIGREDFNPATGRTQQTPDNQDDGSVTVSGTIAHLVLHNGIPLTAYRVSVCGNGDGSSCGGVGSFTTDASGSATTDIDLLKAMGSAGFQPWVFVVETQNTLTGTINSKGAVFVSGFNVK